MSLDDKKLAVVKNRPITQKTIRVVDSYQTLKNHTRIPKKHRKKVRNSKNTTFIYPQGESFRVIDKNSLHHKFIKKFKAMYSTSANESGYKFDINFATKNCDVEVILSTKYFETKASSIIKLNNKNLIRVR